MITYKRMKQRRKWKNYNRHVQPIKVLKRKYINIKKMITYKIHIEIINDFNKGEKRKFIQGD